MDRTFDAERSAAEGTAARSSTESMPTLAELPDRTALPGVVLGAFEGDIAPVKAAVGYRLGILLVAVVMVILPVLYVAIIGLIGWAVYYHAVHDVGIVGMAKGRAAAYTFMAYLAPIVVGVTVILFMLKPLVSWPAKRSLRKPLLRQDEPLLFDFVDRICQAVGAPRPRQIEIDEQVNASAGFRRGVLSMLGHDLVLTIGVPLVAGLNMRQFSGVLAHEFGHFAQGAGMRLTYVIRSISGWFTRVVYERDRWDEWLVQMSRGADPRYGILIWLARGGVWLTRRILWCLMMIGHSVSALMMRQMEFDADQYETRLAGSAAFEATSKQMTLLNVAASGARSDLGDFYREGRLCDDLPRLILHNASQFGPDVLEKIRRMNDESKTGWLDTHPCDNARIAASQRANSNGIFRLEWPAAALFSDFDQLCVRATRDYYEEIFGEQFKPESVFPLAQLLARQSVEHDAFRALHRFLQGNYRIDRPLCLPAWQSDDAPSVLKAAALDKELRDTRQQMLEAAPGYVDLYAQYAKAVGNEVERCREELQPFELLATRRLLAALRLLEWPAVAAKVERAEWWQEEVARLLPLIHILNEQVTRIGELEFGNRKFEELFQRYSQNSEDEHVKAGIRNQMARSTVLIQGLSKELVPHRYPFEHAEGDIGLDRFALSRMPNEDNPSEIYEAAGCLIESTTRLRARMIGQLCQAAELVEAALDMPPVPEPPMET
jgi:Zn-dependent protease with chaperone function